MCQLRMTTRGMKARVGLEERLECALVEVESLLKSPLLVGSGDL
jgi:predicted proteasome-type protease